MQEAENNEAHNKCGRHLGWVVSTRLSKTRDHI